MTIGKSRSAPKKGTGIAAEGANVNPWVPAFADEPAGWVRFAPWLAFLVLVVLYIATLTPSVAGGDSGELAAAAAHRRVPIPRAIRFSHSWPDSSLRFRWGTRLFGG